MGFGIDIGGALKSAVKSAGDFVSGAAQKAEDGAKAVEQKVAGAVKSAYEGVTGQDGFDGGGGDDHGPGPLAESKPKGGSGTRFA
jgi:hypothetical protein